MELSPREMKVLSDIEASPEWRASMREGRRIAQEWELQAQWHEIMSEYGSMEAWHAFCREQRRGDHDRKLARVVLRLITGSSVRQRGTLNDADSAVLLGDRPLAAYWVSVMNAGDEGWREERGRIVQREREASRAENVTERMVMLDIETVKALLPIWRAWGSILIEAGVINDLDGSFRPIDH